MQDKKYIQDKAKCFTVTSGTFTYPNPA